MPHDLQSISCRLPARARPRFPPRYDVMAMTEAYFGISPYHPVGSARHFRRRIGAGFNSFRRAAQRPQAGIVGAVLAVLATSPAFSAEGAPSGPSEAIFFGQIGLLLIVGR